jgi:hypothetical protein
VDGRTVRRDAEPEDVNSNKINKGGRHNAEQPLSQQPADCQSARGF